MQCSSLVPISFPSYPSYIYLLSLLSFSCIPHVPSCPYLALSYPSDAYHLFLGVFFSCPFLSFPYLILSHSCPCNVPLLFPAMFLSCPFPVPFLSRLYMSYAPHVLQRPSIAPPLTIVYPPLISLVSLQCPFSPSYIPHLSLIRFLSVSLSRSYVPVPM